MKPENDPNAVGDDGGDGRFRFDGIVVDAAAHTLVRDGREQPLEPKAFAVLLALLRRPGELLGRDVLLDEVWGHRHVTPGVLTRAIAQLRAALDDDSSHPRYIQTQHALGYRFIGVLERDDPVPVEESRGQADAAVGSAPAHMGTPSVSSDEPAAPVAAPRDGSVPPSPPPGDDAMPAGWRRGWASGLVVAVVLAAIAWWTHDREGTPPATQASIAVLPFTSLSDARDDRYFAEGLSMEMLDALAGVEGLTVAAWRPPEAIDRTQDIQALGRLLGVVMLLDASVRREGQRLRISARLSDTRTGYTVWSRSYDGEADSVFDTQADIADAVVAALLKVVPEEREILHRRLAPTRSAAAFGDYLSGLRQLTHPEGEGAGRDAEARFRKALAADPAFARAQAGLCRTELWNFESNRDPDAFERARLACQRAMNMDPSLGRVSLAFGDLYRVQGDTKRALEYYNDVLADPALRWQALLGRAQVYVDQGREADAMRDFRQALRLSPGNADVHAQLGYQQYRLGHYPEAIAEFRTAVALRPDVAWQWDILGGLLVAAGDADAAEQALRRALALGPSESTLANLGTLRYQKGDYAGAAALYRRAGELNPKDFFYIGYLADALEAVPATAAEARAAYAQAAGLARRFVDAKPDDAKALAALGWYHAQLGERDAALRLGRQAQALGHEPGEVALFNAQAYAVLGMPDEARAALQSARKSGVSESRITTHAIFRRTGLAGPSAGPAPAPAATTASAEPTTGERP